jgi:hypothetical protein
MEKIKMKKVIGDYLKCVFVFEIPDYSAGLMKPQGFWRIIDRQEME